MSSNSQKKGLSPLAWIGIGCGALVLLGVVAAVGLLGFGLFKAKELVEDLEANPAKTAAEMVVRLNPELELIESDEEAGTITFKNVTTGETMTVDFESIAEGKLSVTTEDGELRIDASEGGEAGMTFTGPDGEVRLGASVENVPDWVPLYPESSDARGTYTSVTKEGSTGVVVLESADDAATVLAYYEEWLADEGYEIKQRSSTSTAEGTLSALQAQLAEPQRTLTISIVEQGGETQVNVNYTEKTP